MTTLKAFYVDSMPTIYAAESSEEAARLYLEDLGGDEEMEPDYPQQVGEEELDRPTPEFDENGEMTGEMTTMRVWLEKSTPGHLCGAE